MVRDDRKSCIIRLAVIQVNPCDFGHILHFDIHSKDCLSVGIMESLLSKQPQILRQKNPGHCHLTAPVGSYDMVCQPWPNDLSVCLTIRREGQDHGFEPRQRWRRLGCP